jgi:hypothetical protein
MHGLIIRDQCATNRCSNQTGDGNDTVESTDPCTKVLVWRNLSYNRRQQRGEVASTKAVEAGKEYNSSKLIDKKPDEDTDASRKHDHGPKKVKAPHTITEKASTKWC